MQWSLYGKDFWDQTHFQLVYQYKKQPMKIIKYKRNQQNYAKKSFSFTSQQYYHLFLQRLKFKKKHSQYISKLVAYAANLYTFTVQVIFQFDGHTIQAQIDKRIQNNYDYFEEQELFKILFTLAKAIYQLHLNSCQHHSLNTSNILITNRRNVILMDPLMAAGSNKQLYKKKGNILLGPREWNDYQKQIFLIGCIILQIGNLRVVKFQRICQNVNEFSLKYGNMSKIIQSLVYERHGAHSLVSKVQSYDKNPKSQIIYEKRYEQSNIRQKSIKSNCVSCNENGLVVNLENSNSKNNTISVKGKGQYNIILQKNQHSQTFKLSISNMKQNLINSSFSQNPYDSNFQKSSNENLRSPFILSQKRRSYKNQSNSTFRQPNNNPIQYTFNQNNCSAQRLNIPLNLQKYGNRKQEQMRTSINYSMQKGNSESKNILDSNRFEYSSDILKDQLIQSVLRKYSKKSIFQDRAFVPHIESSFNQNNKNEVSIGKSSYLKNQNNHEVFKKEPYSNQQNNYISTKQENLNEQSRKQNSIINPFHQKKDHQIINHQINTSFNSKHHKQIQTQIFQKPLIRIFPKNNTLAPMSVPMVPIYKNQYQGLPEQFHIYKTSIDLDINQVTDTQQFHRMAEKPLSSNGKRVINLVEEQQQPSFNIINQSFIKSNSQKNQNYGQIKSLFTSKSHSFKKDISKPLSKHQQNEYLTLEGQKDFELIRDKKRKKKRSSSTIKKLSNKSSNSNLNIQNVQNYNKHNIPLLRLNQIGSGSSESQKDHLNFVIQNFKQGSKYQGFCKNGMRHGRGKFFYSDGGCYDGQWKNNTMTGKGKLFYQSDTLAYQGQWLNDMFHGKGILYNDYAKRLQKPFNYNNMQDVQKFWTKYQGKIQQ